MEASDYPYRDHLSDNQWECDVCEKVFEFNVYGSRAECPHCGAEYEVNYDYVDEDSWYGGLELIAE